MLARIRKSMDEKDQGFTLIELLVVMIIIGILAAIAIPVFLNQRQKAVDSSIKSDLKTAADFEETYSIDHNAYTNVKANFTAANVKFSPNNVVEAAFTATGYCLRGSNTQSSATGTNFFWYDSTAGGLAPNGASATQPSGSCAGTPTFITVS